MAIRGIGFDIDGTLYPNRQMFLLSFPSLLRSPRLVWHFSRVRKEIRQVETISHFRALQAEMIARSMNTDPVKTRLLVEKRLYQNWESDFRYLKPYPYVKQLLEELKNRGDLKLGVLSDFPVQNKLSFLGLENFWDAALSSEEVNYLKPRPEPFLALAERMELAPEEILYVGNSPRYDITGASQVGMKTTFLGPAAKDPGADFRFTDYRRLRNYIMTLLP